MKHLVFMTVLMLVLSIAVAYGISWAFAIEFTGKYLIGFYLCVCAVRMGLSDIVTLNTVIKTNSYDIIEKRIQQMMDNAVDKSLDRFADRQNGNSK
jgi:hypothetical protein